MQNININVKIIYRIMLSLDGAAPPKIKPLITLHTQVSFGGVGCYIFPLWTEPG